MADSITKVRCGHSEALGRFARGVFAEVPLRAGETIEVAPVIVIPQKQRSTIESTVLEQYVFQWGGGCTALVLGYGSLYNHSSDPNADYYQDTERRQLEFVALRPIEAGEEITINYIADGASGSAIWFPVKEI